MLYFWKVLNFCIKILEHYFNHSTNNMELSLMLMDIQLQKLNV